jgi:SAM-dependent methyltransferase
LQRAAGRYSDEKVRAFDRRYETDTFERIDLGVLGIGERDDALARWQYGPINPDFFREIMRAGPADLHRLTFLDVGSGKGLALMLASEYRFRRIVGVEMSKELNEVARRNLAAYAKNGGSQVETHLICADFNLLALPLEPTFYFLNNPFPEHLAHEAVSHFEASFAANPRDAWVLWRRCTLPIIDRLDASPHLDLTVATPYWRLYRTRAGA